MGGLITHIKGFAAKLEAEKIKERTIRGKMERVKAGRLPGGRFSKLYGYNYIKGKGPGEGVRYINEDESKVVKEIYRLFLEEDMSLCKITQRLNTLGILPPSGKGSWNRTGVHSILRNPAYMGKTYLFTRYKVEAKRHLKQSRRNKYTHVVMRPREEWVELRGATPAIISEELFNQVQCKLKRNKELASRNTKHEYLLAGYVFCGHCRRRYTAHTKGRNAYYSCPKCKRRNLNTKYLEPSIWKQVEDVLSKPEVVMASIEAINDDKNDEEYYHRDIKSIELKLRHMSKEKDRIWKAFEITGDESKFTREIKEIMLRIEELEKRKIELENKIELIGQAESNIQSIKEYCELVNRNLGDLSFSEKRKALESLRIKVIVGENNLKLEGIIPVVSGQCA